MNTRRMFLILVILLALPALACNALSSDSTATPTPAEAVAATEAPPEPSATALPTEPPATETPAPTATLEPTAAPAMTLTSYESETAGITLEFPADWTVLDLFFLAVASDPALLDQTEIPQEGGVVAIFPGGAEEYPAGSPAEILESSLGELEVENAELIDGPTETEIQGQEAAIARIRATADDGTPLEGFVALITNEDRVALAMALTPLASSEEYLPILEDIINSIEVGQPAVDDSILDIPTDPGGQPADETVLIAPGDIFSHSIPDDTYLEYAFRGTPGEPVLIVVNPAEDFDPVIEVYPAADPENMVADVDDGASGEAEAIEFTPEAEAEFIIRVRPFGFSGGAYDIFLLDENNVLVIEGTIPEDETVNTRVCVPAGEPLIAVMIPDEDLDAVLDLLGPGGGSLLDSSIDNAFSGELELIVFTEGAEFGDEPYPVIIAASGFAGQGGDFILLIGPVGVVQDGC